MKNNGLISLNNHLFETLERLNDDELMEQQGEKEIARAKAITGVAHQIVNNGKLMLDAQKYRTEYEGYKENSLPEILKIGNEQ